MAVGLNPCECRVAQNGRNGRAWESVLEEQVSEFDGIIAGGVCAATSLLRVAHPDGRMKAPKQLDSARGSERCSDLEDSQSLLFRPNAFKFVTPIRRWTITRFMTMSFQRWSTCAHIVNSLHLFSIPEEPVWGCWSKGVTFYDPEFYDDPEIFRPESFLNSEFFNKPGADLAGRRPRPDLHFGGGCRARIHAAFLQTNICLAGLVLRQRCAAIDLSRYLVLNVPNRIKEKYLTTVVRRWSAPDFPRAQNELVRISYETIPVAAAPRPHFVRMLIRTRLDMNFKSNVPKPQCAKESPSQLCVSSRLLQTSSPPV
ncbi:hypothetical protein EW146_g9088 [Bondarzewia mesenterica]|uniref:Uncharacterized protein n=1 Tax=Bondarzewia mesenterica TaxID=1095465 RepID=A0A4S4LAQ0_9AGAM|nr:hypothetical protein EW146_g9088 [Bondarzewia mesenterica]